MPPTARRREQDLPTRRVVISNTVSPTLSFLGVYTIRSTAAMPQNVQLNFATLVLLSTMPLAAQSAGIILLLALALAQLQKPLPAHADQADTPYTTRQDNASNGCSDSRF
jgi:hypothetical protein